MIGLWWALWVLVGCQRTPDASTFVGAASAPFGAEQVAARFDPDPPKEKGNTVWLRVTSAGQPVEMPLTVEAFMPQMGAMPEMRAPAEVRARGGGIASATFDLPMSGGWTLVVRSENQREARFGFTVGARGLVGASERAVAAEPEALPALTFGTEAVSALGAAFQAYEEVRAALSHDTLAPVPGAAARIGQGLRTASAGARPDAAGVLARAAAAADRLAAAPDLPEARRAFGEVSRGLVAIGGADPRLAEGQHVFACPMVTDGFPRWFQPSEALDNPYMGLSMATCGSPSTWTASPAATAGDAAAVSLDAARRQEYGVRTAPVVAQSLRTEVRAAGEIVWDETKLVDVTLTTGGYVRGLTADQTGMEVRRGQVLLTLYGPELYPAQQEYLLALRNREVSGQALIDASRDRLRLLGLSEAQIAALEARGEAQLDVPVLAPVSGYVVDKDVVEGAKVEAGQRLFRLAPLDEVWAEAEVFPDQIALVAVGQPALVTASGNPRRWEGAVSFLHPRVDAGDRTRKVRVALANPDHALLPGMFVDVVLPIDLGERLVVPVSAVLYTGPRRIVFVEVAEGRFEPRTIEVGAETDAVVEVRSGLAAGESVVVAGTFLVAAESRLRSADAPWGGADGAP